MGWFAKIKKTEQETAMDYETAPDKDNPYSRGIEDEGELVTIVHARNIKPFDDIEDEKEIEENGDTND
ncbi:MAG: hypothetical protein CMB80_02250 [Flammeovirgaceae bacterium]|nr:hypothetical protein [Flammeovirgaceae bacterium]